jgi:membrane-associated phospholipid phosphatase
MVCAIASRPRQIVADYVDRASETNGANDFAGPRTWRAWRCYFRQGSLYFAAYVIFFNLTSWIGALHGSVGHFYLPVELGIPFSPVWIWAYASMFVAIAVPPLFLGEAQLKRLGLQSLAVLLIASACFVVFPAELGFMREVPDASPYRQIFAWLFAIDRPNNLVPSLHVAISTLCIAGFIEATTSFLGRLALWGWLVAITASTVLVHQHHLIDVATGMALAYGVRRCLLLTQASGHVQSSLAPQGLPEHQIVENQ